MPLQRCATAVEAVDWVAVDAQLPTGQDPDSKARRKALFDRLDPTQNGLLSLFEAQSGLPPLLNVKPKSKPGVPAYQGPGIPLVPITDWKPVIKHAFEAAQDITEKTRAGPDGLAKAKPKAKPKAKAKGEAKEKMVDRKEFHALLVAFRMFLELQVLFDSIDVQGAKAGSEHGGDRLLTLAECEAQLPLLSKWGFTRRRLQDIFSANSVRSLRYDEFASICIKRRTFVLGLDLNLDEAEESGVAAERRKNAPAGQVVPGDSVTVEGDVLGQKQERVRDLFRDWDCDGNGCITEEELTLLLQKLNPSITQADAKDMFVACDQNSDGKVDYNEFLSWIFQKL